jgi:hypothetical protein
MYEAIIKDSLSDKERKKLLSNPQSENAPPIGQYVGSTLLSQVQVNRHLRALRPVDELPDELQIDPLLHIAQARAAMHAGLNWRKRRT